MNRAIFLTLVSIAFAVPAAAQHHGTSYISVTNGRGPIQQGSGHFVRQSRATGAFSAIETNGAADVEVVAGGAPMIEVETDDNLLDNIETRIEGDRLIVTNRGSFRTSRAPVVRVSLERLRSAETSGSGKVTIRGLRDGDLTLSGRGSGDFRAEGTVARLQLYLHGSGNADLTRLNASDVVARVNGSGNARIRAEHSLDATANGSGSLVYEGPASLVRAEAHGTGTVRRGAM